MIGRESRESNNLFFTCSLIDYIARKTRNRRCDVVSVLGRKRIEDVLELADVYHSDNIDSVSDGLIAEAGISQGDFDNVALAHYAVPSHWDVGKVYRRLIEAVAAKEGIGPVDALMKVYASPISDKIDDYNSSFYYESPSYILESYLDGRPL